MILALRFSMKETKSARRRVWCSYLYPSPLRMLRYFSSAERRLVIARLPAREGSMFSAHRCRPSRKSGWCRGSRAAATVRSPTKLRQIGEARWRDCVVKYGGDDECNVRVQLVRERLER